jgi:hypothetical protein
MAYPEARGPSGVSGHKTRLGVPLSPSLIIR